MSQNILANLNERQRDAVSSTAQTLAILAGPGSGKTHTLTSRTAWLLGHEGLQPWNIIVATFTVKAAREMKERIGKLIGNGLEKKLILGTFHSIARRYLARYGHLIGIPKDFGIADTQDSKAIVKRICKSHRLTIEPNSARSRISHLKAKGGLEALKGTKKSQETQEIQICYEEYEASLKKSNLLDYDDLLLRCVELLRKFPGCVSNVEAVLIDEFQDTNIVQFDLMRLFASQRKRVTIVGDPDQSIYGFRAAETKNFNRMMRQYPDTAQIPLEENYRSSGCILLAAMEVIQQDENRIKKSLTATHEVGTRPVLRLVPSAKTEGIWIVLEIKRCLTLMGNLLNYDDVAILLRSSALSRHIETALGQAGIPYRMIGGKKFYDRVEVKIIIDYLRVINQLDNNDALLRIINIPARGIGDVTIKSIIEEANETGSSIYNLILNSVQGRKTLKAKLSNKMQQGLSSLMNVFLTWQKKLSDPENRSTIVDLMEHVIKKISWHEYLKTQYPDAEEARWANVQELINLAADFSQQQSEDEDDEALPPIDGLPQQDSSNPLSKFLANITLASDIKAEEEGPPKPMVTISTIHAAKGLEWPVVFIPSAYQGSIPHSRAEDADEERRLLYVAMTRAKALLYLSCPLKNSEREYTMLSPFLQSQNVKVHLANQGPSLRTNVVQGISKILRRPSYTPANAQLALDTIPSLEDDQFPIELEDLEGEDEKWKDWDGTKHSYTKGQQLPKRQRIGGERSNGKNEMGYQENSTSWKPEYKTTMNQVSSFTTASAAMKNGLLTTTKTEILCKQSVNLIVERPITLEQSRSQKRDHTPDIEEVIEHPVKKTTKSRTTKRPEGQASITSFMSRPSGYTVVKSSEKAPILSRSHTTPAPFPKQTRNDSYQRSQPASYSQLRDASLPTFPRSSQYTCSTFPLTGIDPALSTHRLGNFSLPAPNRRFARGSTPPGKNQAYVFLSSSPQRPPTRHVEGVQELPSIPRPVDEPQPPITKPQVPPRINQPARTMHVTSMDRIAASGQRKTYGAKMGMNGWADRMKREK